MRKSILKAAIFALAVLLSVPCFSQADGEINQALIPLEIYPGDQAEIRYTFRSAVDFFPGSSIQIEKQIDVAKLPFDSLSEKCTVKKVVFSRNDMEYTLSIFFVPWQVGKIEFPEFDILPLVTTRKISEDNKMAYMISLKPVVIQSIVEKTQINTMRPPAPPLIIPGTTYVIFAISLFSVLAIFLILRFLLKFKEIRIWWKEYLQRRLYKKNADMAVKKIKRLVKAQKVSDIEFCSALQNITRGYLEFRFSYPFSAASASGIRLGFAKIFAGDIPSDVAFCIEDLSSMFIRTDYIRYAHDSIDSNLYPPSEHQAALVSYERKSLSDSVLKVIDIFESRTGYEE